VPRALAALVVLLAAGARADPVLTLEDAIRTARRNHPSVEAQRGQVAIARGRTQQAAAGLLPYLTGSFGYQPQTPNLIVTPSIARTLVGNTGNAQVFDTGGTAITVSCRTPGVGSCAPLGGLPTSWSLHNFWLANVGVAWTVWDWGHSIYALESSRALGQAARVGVTTVQRNVTLDVTVAFFAAIAADDRLAVARDGVANFRQHVDQTRAFHDAGLRTGIDVATVESGLANVELVLARAGADREVARAQLAVALGVDRLADWTLVADPHAFEPQPSDARATQPPTTLAAVALRQRTEVRQLELQALGNARTVKSARGLYLPQLTLVLGPSWGGTELGSLTGNFDVTLAVGYPSSGMSPLLVHGQVVEAEGNLVGTHAAERALRDAIRQETRDAQAELAAASEALRAALALVEAATRQKSLAEGRYATGVGTIIELSDALLNFVNARDQLVQARLGLATARAQLQHALGEDAPP
jgi:outer membrane protein TolC